MRFCRVVRARARQFSRASCDTSAERHEKSADIPWFWACDVSAPLEECGLERRLRDRVRGVLAPIMRACSLFRDRNQRSEESVRQEERAPPLRACDHAETLAGVRFRHSPPHRRAFRAPAEALCRAGCPRAWRTRERRSVDRDGENFVELVDLFVVGQCDRQFCCGEIESSEHALCPAANHCHGEIAEGSVANETSAGKARFSDCRAITRAESSSRLR